MSLRCLATTSISNPVVATGMNAMLFTAGVFNPSAMWGPPIPAGPGYTSRDVTLNLEKLRGLPMYVSSAEGVSNMFSDPDVLNRPVPAAARYRVARCDGVYLPCLYPAL